MKQVTISLYSFNELSEEAQEKAIIEHANFLVTTAEDEDEFEYSREDVIDNILVNEYIFFQDGTLAHCTTYTGKHQKAGTTEFHFKGITYTL